MTTLTVPLVNIGLAALTPDVVRSCIVLQPSPPPDPGEEPPAPVGDDAIYTPVAPGVTYETLPVTPAIIDTSPDQMIGCIVTVANNPQGRLNALFPSAVDGDGVIDRATNDIWVYDGATWNNVGPTPGPTIVATVVIPPWNEIVSADAITRTKLDITSLDYALTLLTEPDPVVTQTALLARNVPAYVAVPSTDFTFTVYTPTVASGAAVLPPVAATTLASPAVAVSSGGSAAVPLIDFTFAASAVPYVGTAATVLQPNTAVTSLQGLNPAVLTGATIEPPAADIGTAGQVPILISKPAPSFISFSAQNAATTSFTISNITTQIDDIVLAIVEISGDATAIAPTPSSAFSASFAQITGSPVIADATTAGTNLQLWWMRSAANTTSSITFNDTGDHQLARCMVIRGCVASSDPWDAAATDTNITGSGDPTAPAATTTVGNTFVVSVIARASDTSSTGLFGTPTNSVLSSFTNRGEAGTSVGNGGGFVVTTGIKQLPGSTGITTFPSSFVHPTALASMTVAFKP